MTSTAAFVRSAAALSVAAMLVGCSDTAPVVSGPVPVNPLFQSYVALGNSITAGYQSGGINDSTQRESYARLFALQVNTRYAYASLAGNGCPAPIVTFPSTRSDTTSCALRTPSSIGTTLNNVAVPGATSFDPTSVTTSASNPLTMFILGGKTQVQRAADVRPTFVSAWVGNNDVLAPAVTGTTVGVTAEPTFETNYNAMITALQAIPTVKGGVLIGVVNVVNAPILFPVAALFNPTFKAGFDLYAGKVTTLDVSCGTAISPSASLVSFQIVAAMRGGASGAISCAPGTAFVLDPTEIATLTTAVTNYNAFIQATATTLGWAYYDPNTTLATLKAQPGCILSVPNLASTTETYGTCVSLDGVHPTGVAHKAIVNDLIDAVNARYSTTIAHVS